MLETEYQKLKPKRALMMIRAAVQKRREREQSHKTVKSRNNQIPRGMETFSLEIYQVGT